MKCPFCGFDNDTRAAFCGNCGRYLGWETKPPDDVTETVEEEQVPETEPEVIDLPTEENGRSTDAKERAHEQVDVSRTGGGGPPSVSGKHARTEPNVFSKPAPHIERSQPVSSERIEPRTNRPATRYTMTRQRQDPLQVIASEEPTVARESVNGAKSADGRRGLFLVMEPKALQIEAGATLTSTVRLRNTGSLVERYDLNVEGLPADWVTLEPPSVNVDRGEEATVIMHLHVPRKPTSYAGRHPFEAVAWSASDPTVRCLEACEVDVGPFEDTRLEVEPLSSEGKRTGEHALRVLNGGNAPLQAGVEASDDEGKLRFLWRPDGVQIGPGRVEDIQLSAVPKRRLWFGTPQVHRFKIEVLPRSGTPVYGSAAMTHVPFFPRWAVKAVTLFLAATVAIGALIGIPAFQNRPREVPNVITQQADPAQQILKSKGFKQVIPVKRASNKTVGEVINQDPGPGQSQRADKPITLIVSNGPDAFELPDVRGGSIANAEKLLNARGLKPVRAGTKPDDSAAAGTVLEQQPPPRTSVKPGDVIQLTTSTGKVKVKVPQVTNDKEPAAQQKLTAAKLSFKTKTKVATNPAQIDRVIDQNPKPETEVVEGTDVEITVAIAPTSPSAPGP